jgi:hypothetical protein
MTKKEFKALFARDKQLWYLHRIRQALIQALIYTGEDVPVLINKTPKDKRDIEQDLAYCQTMKIQTFDPFMRSLWGGIANSLSERLLTIQRKESWANRDPSKQSQRRPLEETKMYPITSICDNHNLQHFKAGSNREKMCCPFHNEKTPSLVIFTDKNRYWCFGCNSGGSVLDFVSKVDNLSLSDAIKTINSLIG